MNSALACRDLRRRTRSSRGVTGSTEVLSKRIVSCFDRTTKVLSSTAIALRPARPCYFRHHPIPRTQVVVAPAAKKCQLRMDKRPLPEARTCVCEPNGVGVENREIHSKTFLTLSYFFDRRCDTLLACLLHTCEIQRRKHSYEGLRGGIGANASANLFLVEKRGATVSELL